MIKVNIIE